MHLANFILPLLEQGPRRVLFPGDGEGKDRCEGGSFAGIHIPNEIDVLEQNMVS